MNNIIIGLCMPKELVSTQIFYFSGAGNSRKVALWLADESQKMDLPTDVVSIESCSTIDKPIQNSATGFVFPIHGFTTIWAMLWFIIRFPRASTGASAFLVNTSGGTKLGPVLIPGWEGTGLYLPALILFFKGYQIIGTLPLRFTPGHWAALFPSYTPENAQKLMTLR